MVVYVLLIGSGDDGDEQYIGGVFSTRAKAEEAAKEYGSRGEVKEWEVQ